MTMYYSSKWIHDFLDSFSLAGHLEPFLSFCFFHYYRLFPLGMIVLAVESNGDTQRKDKEKKRSYHVTPYLPQERIPQEVGVRPREPQRMEPTLAHLDPWLSTAVCVFSPSPGSMHMMVRERELPEFWWCSPGLSWPWQHSQKVKFNEKPLSPVMLFKQAGMLWSWLE